MCISVGDQSKTVDVYVRKDWLDGDLLSCPPGAPRGSPVQRSQGCGPGKPPCSGQRAPHRPDLPAGSPGSGGQTLSGTSPASSSPPTQTTTWDLNTGRHRGQRIYSSNLLIVSPQCLVSVWFWFYRVGSDVCFSPGRIQQNWPGLPGSGPPCCSGRREEPPGFQSLQQEACVDMCSLCLEKF